MIKMGLFGFGKKKDKPYRVVHYEGIESVAVNIPCAFLIKDEVLNINFKSGLNVTLPMQRVVKFEAMGENDFMMKYKATNTISEKNMIPVSYLVITYTDKSSDEKRIVLWAANLREIMYFTDLHYKYRSIIGNIEL